jgi:hypothetical protein
MYLKEACLFWSGEDATVAVMPKEWLNGTREHWGGRGVELPTEEDIANPAKFFLRQFVSMTYEVGVKPDDVVSAFNQIKEFVELTHDVADGDLRMFSAM